jgi:hypothetical protein
MRNWAVRSTLDSGVGAFCCHLQAVTLLTLRMLRGLRHAGGRDVGGCLVAVVVGCLLLSPLTGTVAYAAC